MDENEAQAIQDFERQSADAPQEAASVLLSLAEIDTEKAAQVLYQFEDRDLAADVLLELSDQGTVTTATMLLNMYYWADGPDGVLALLIDAGSENAGTVGGILLAMFASDDIVAGSVTASLAQSDPEVTGNVLLGAAREDSTSLAGIVCLAAGTNAQSVGQALVHSAAQDAGTTQGVLGSVQDDRDCVSDLGSSTPVDAWMPENPPQEGGDSIDDGAWRDVGSPPPIDNILARFAANFPDGPYTDIVSVLDRLSEFRELPEGSIAYDVLSIQPQGFTSDDTPAAHVTMFIDKQWLTANQVHEWSMQFSRYDASTNAWVPTQSKRAREDETNVYFTVTVPGFSIWAIHGSKSPPPVRFVESDLHIDPATIEPGEEVTVSFEVTNQTEEPATYFANLWVSGQIARVEEYPVGPRDTIKVKLPIVVSAEGAHPIRVGSQISAQPLLVENAAPPATVDTSESDRTPLLPILGGLSIAGVILIGAVAVFLLTRRQQRKTA